MALCLHVDAKKTSYDKVASVATPPANKSHFPIPHTRLIDLVGETLERGGIDIQHVEHALTQGGQRYFGIFHLAGKNDASHRTLIGLRNAHDRSLAAGLCLGSQVFVCDNLAFDGAVKIQRRHTRFIMRDLPGVVATAFGEIKQRIHDFDTRFNVYKTRELTRPEINDLLIRSLETRAITATGIPHILADLRTPRHAEFADSTAYSLFNAFTEYNKKYDAGSQATRSTRLVNLFDDYCGLSLALAS